jgi:L-lactate dehydrogenase complex protein LldG
MKTNGKKKFISRVRQALGREPDLKRTWPELALPMKDDENQELLNGIMNRSSQERHQLMHRLIEESRLQNLEVIAVKNAASAASDIVRIIQQKRPEFGRQKRVVAWRHPLIESLDLETALKKQNIDVPVYYTNLEDKPQQAVYVKVKRAQIRDRISEAFIGVTSADYCLAETATLVMGTRPGRARSVSLVPGIHIAVIRKENIIANLKELYALINHDAGVKSKTLTNCMTFITGPSKTADIEAFMVHGAHGPRELYLFVLTG